jgi:hypothetical protein
VTANHRAVSGRVAVTDFRACSCQSFGPKIVFRVAGTGRMSMHGHAAAIDLNLKVSDDRLWAAKGKTSPSTT